MSYDDGYGGTRESVAIKPLGWTPVRVGNIYCSPACGAGCTYDAFETAHQNAKDLVSRLGSNWTARVWENLGWHFSAVSSDGRIQVHRNRLGSWCATLNRWVAHDDSPLEAVAAVVQRAKDEIAALQSLVDGW